MPDSPPPSESGAASDASPTKTWLTLVPALAALFGAAIGGFFTCVGTQIAADEETERLDNRDATQARAAARVLVGDYEYAQAYFQQTIRDRPFPVYDPSVRIDLPRAEERQLAAEMTPDEWATVNSTNLRLDNAFDVVRAAEQDRQPLDPVNPVGRDVVLSVAVQLDAGKKALRRLAALGEHHPRPDYPRR
jgi:hypothetical protein